MKIIFHKYRPHYQENLKLAIPVIISQVGHMAVQMSDSIIVGHFVGTVALAAVALVNSIFIVAMVMGMGISYAITPLIAQENGKGNFAECGRLLSNSLIINVITSIVLFILVYFGAGILMQHLDQSPAVIQQANPFLLLLSASIIPMMLFTTFKQFAEGLGFTKQAMTISIWGNMINVALGIIFVKGLFGVKPMGISGVGYSTLIDRTLMAVVMGSYVFRSELFRKYLRTFSLGFIDKVRCLKLLRIGAPIAMQYTFEVSAFGAAAIMMGVLGPIQQAAHQVAINLAAMTYMVASGLSAAAAIKSGNHFGAKNYSLLRDSSLASYHIVIAMMTVAAMIFILCNQWLPWIITSDRAVIAVASELLILAAIFQLFDGTQVVGLGILRGMGDVNVPTMITFLAYWVVGLPIGYWLGLHTNAGPIGVWIGLVAGLVVASVLLYMRFNLISRRHLDA